MPVLFPALVPFPCSVNKPLHWYLSCEREIPFKDLIDFHTFKSLTNGLPLVFSGVFAYSKIYFISFLLRNVCLSVCLNFLHLWHLHRRPLGHCTSQWQIVCNVSGGGEELMDDANEAEPFITVTRNTTTVLHSNYDNLVVTEVNLLPSCKATTEMCDGSNVGHLRSHEFRQNFHLLGHYRPQLRKGYAFTGVCHSVHDGGVYLSMHRADISQHALGADTSPLGRHIPACTGADTPPPTATAADRTHPTGMHSCWNISSIEPDS